MSKQTILDFEAIRGIPAGAARLRVWNSEQEYFAGQSAPGWEFTVTLPDPIEDTARSGATPSPDTVREFGRRLWEALPDGVRARVREGASSGEPIAVLSTRTAIDDLPWEWLQAGDEVAGSTSELRVIRIVPAMCPAPSLTAETIRVLIAPADRADESLWGPGSEALEVAEDLKLRPEYKLRELTAATASAIERELHDSQHVLHYFARSATDSRGSLMLCDSGEGTRWFAPAEVARLCPSTLRLMCFSTCGTDGQPHSGFLSKLAHSPAEIPLPTAVLNRYAVTKSAARTFWDEFYESLAMNGGDAVQAVHAARKRLRTSFPGESSWGAFAIVVRDGSGRPFRTGKTEADSSRRLQIEIEAQWSARLANNLAIRMRSLHSDVQKHWRKTVDEELDRTRRLERSLEE
jgi:hypothetical protein